LEGGLGGFYGFQLVLIVGGLGFFQVGWFSDPEDFGLVRIGRESWAGGRSAAEFLQGQFLIRALRWTWDGLQCGF
jgi:hypothetical protein